jgi:hypothetical protein
LIFIFIFILIFLPLFLNGSSSPLVDCSSVESAQVASTPTNQRTFINSSQKPWEVKICPKSLVAIISFKNLNLDKT